MNFTVIQSNTRYDLIQISLSHILITINVIDFLLQIFWMSQFRSQITVIGQQQYTSCITVQTSYRINTFLTSTFYKIHNSLTLLRVIRSSNTVLRLVQQNVYFTFDINRLIVELNFICTFYLCTKFSNHYSIYRNNSGSNKFISLTTRTDSSICQEFIQTNWFIRISQYILVFYLLLHAILSIRIIVGCTRTVSSTLLAIVSSLLSATIIETRTLRTISTFTLLCIIKTRAI